MLSQYEEMKKVFQLNCRVYRMQRKEMEDMKMRYPGIDDYASSAGKIIDDKSTFEAGKRYWFLKQGVNWVENVFRVILNEYGDLAYRMFYIRFIECRTQEDAAHELGVTRRQLQYEEDKIVRSLMKRFNEGQKFKQI